MKRLVRGILLKPALNLTEWLLKRDGGNSLIIGGPLGWSWQATLDTAHHGALSGPADAHRHGDLASIGIDDHHDRDHAALHHSGGADALALGSIAGNLTASQHGSAVHCSGRFGMSRMPDGASGYVLTAQGAGSDPVYAAASGGMTTGERALLYSGV
jgi:hypothetical protein